MIDHEYYTLRIVLLRSYLADIVSDPKRSKTLAVEALKRDQAIADEQAVKVNS